ncbi:MAG: hypothetical protein ACYS0G_12660 [Planctomycetota bacterium]|jgi:hypothetical protein
MDEALQGAGTTTVTLKDWKEIAGVNSFHRLDVSGGQMDMTMNYTRIQVTGTVPSWPAG